MSPRGRKPIPPDVRDRAVKAVEDMLPHTQSLTEAIRVVATSLGVHPNSIRNWRAAAEPLRLRPAGSTAAQRVAAAEEQARVLAQLNAELVRSLREQGRTAPR